MNPIAAKNKHTTPSPQAGDLEIIRQKINPAFLQEMITKAKAQGISDADIDAGLTMLGTKR